MGSLLLQPLVNQTLLLARGEKRENQGGLFVAMLKQVSCSRKGSNADAVIQTINCPPLSIISDGQKRKKQ